MQKNFKPMLYTAPCKHRWPGERAVQDKLLSAIAVYALELSTIVVFIISEFPRISYPIWQIAKWERWRFGWFNLITDRNHQTELTNDSVQANKIYFLMIHAFQKTIYRALIS